MNLNFSEIINDFNSNRHSKLSLDIAGMKSGTQSLSVDFMLATNSRVTLSVNGRKFLTLCGELSPFCSSERIFHHSIPFLKKNHRLNDF